MEARTIGRYALFGEIAAGGMATVSFGRLSATAGFAKTVAIKSLHPQFARDPEFREMFVNEARLAARVRHPNVAQVLDVVTTDGELFVVMEYVHGESLSRLLKASRGQPIPAPVACAIIGGVLHGLHAAHEAKDDDGDPLGLVHRDVSPHNILVGADGVARVIDFGIAKAQSSANMTREGEVRGKLPYLAPEQFGLHAELDRRADVYSAGVCLWEALAGRRLFDAPEQPQIYAAVIAGASAPPSRYARDVPNTVDRVVMRALARNPNARFMSAREMALALEDALAPATASQVGAWVERTAGPELESRAKRLAVIEREGTPPPVEKRAAMRPPMSSRPLIGRPSQPPPSEPSTGLPPPDIDPLAPTAPPPPAPQAPAASVLPAPPKKRGRGGDVILVLAILGVLAGAAYAALPSIVRGNLASRAAAHGMTFEARQVDASLKAIKLKDAELRASDLPGVSIKAHYATLVLEGFAIARVEASEVEITLDGSYGPLVASLQRFRDSHDLGLGAPLRAIDADEVHVVWTRPFGDTTRLEAENAKVTIEQREGHALGEDLTTNAPIVKLATPLGPIGPYAATITRDPESLHARALLDSTGAAIGEMTLDKGGTWSLSVTTPPLPPDRLGLPRPLAIAAGISGTFRCGAPGKDQADGQIDLTFDRVRTGAGTYEARIQAQIGGDATRPLPIGGGMLTLAGARAPIAGSVDVSGGNVRIDASFKSASRPCEGTPGEREQFQGQIAIDLRHLDEARVTAAPVGRCPMPWLK